MASSDALTTLLANNKSNTGLIKIGDVELTTEQLVMLTKFSSTSTSEPDLLSRLRDAPLGVSPERLAELYKSKQIVPAKFKSLAPIYLQANSVKHLAVVLEHDPRAVTRVVERRSLGDLAVDCFERNPDYRPCLQLILDQSDGADAKLAKLFTQKTVTSDEVITAFMGVCQCCLRPWELRLFRLLGLSLTEHQIKWSDDKTAIMVAPIFILALVGNKACVKYCLDQGYRFPTRRDYVLLLREIITDIESMIKDEDNVDAQLEILEVLLRAHKYIV